VGVAAVAGWTGRMMIRAGVLLLLFVAYQLWGTGIHTSRAQDDLARRFRAALEAASNPPAGESATAATPPATAPADLPPPEPGSPVGRILIPDIGVDFIIVEGVELRYLENGPGHFPNTPLPGQPGNSALAGHRTTFAAPFHRLDELAPGDLVTVETLQGTFTYEVLPQAVDPATPPQGHRIVTPEQFEILDDKGDNRLTLMACHPKYSAAKRIVVEAKLVNTPAPPTPRPERLEANPFVGEDLTGGNPAARVPAALWSLAVLAVWTGTWLAGRRWPRWRRPAYALALPVWVLCLYAAFENINELLPRAY
jgi:sortase A